MPDVKKVPYYQLESGVFHSGKRWKCHAGVIGCVPIDAQQKISFDRRAPNEPPSLPKVAVPVERHHTSAPAPAPAGSPAKQQNHPGRAMKAISILLKAILTVVVICLVVAIAWMFLPADARNAITLFSLKNAKGMIFAITSIIFVLYVYRLVRNIDHFSRTKRVGLAIVTLGFLAFFYLVNFRGITADDTDCQRFNYNAKLNGGIKQVDGTTYIVNICGSGHRSNGLFADQNEQVKIVVADAHGSILATRLFFVFWGGRPGNDPIEIHDGKLIYFDASDAYDSTRTISMPPTTMDWVAARIPILLR
ncbi:hypothetical protein [Burkholderia lata]|uniref:hypothetical protein n=1 Tax=Burkholderia lata (strain ATCC 17760 / DSM 23089 / LMG 22485 / NCIMB 9086 / R18194 / 383) TaxID=482957 RepID=UPI0020C6FC29|nr:hypothetical protein [Burkholderia lata]